MDNVKKILKFSLLLTIVSIIFFIVFIANELVNTYDGLWWGNEYMAFPEWELTLGRYLLLPIDALKNGMHLEPINTILSLFLLSVSLSLILELFNMLNANGLILSLMVIFSSTVSCILSYRFTSNGFMFGIFFSALSAYSIFKIENRILSIVVSVISLIFSLALYQAQIVISGLVFIFYTIVVLLNNQDVKVIYKKIINYIISFVVGAFSYYGILLILIKIFNVKLANYKGADKISLLRMIENIPRTVVISYKYFVDYFFKNAIIKHDFFFNAVFYGAVIILINIVFLIFIIKKLKEKRLDVGIFAIIFLICSPLALNLYMFFCVDGEIVAQTTIGYATYLTVALVAVFYLLRVEINLKIIKKVQLLFTLIAVIIVCGRSFQTTIDIISMKESREKCISLMRGVINELQDNDLYSSKYVYVFLGTPYKNELYRKDTVINTANDYAKVGNFKEKPDCLYFSYYGLTNFMGENLNSSIQYYEVYTQIKNKNIYKEMENYPSDKSIIKSENDIVIVKISD